MSKQASEATEENILSMAIREIDTWPFVKEQRQWHKRLTKDEQCFKNKVLTQYKVESARIRDRVQEIKERQLSFITYFLGVFLGLMGGIIAAIAFLPHDFAFTWQWVTIALLLTGLLVVFTLGVFIFLGPRVRHSITLNLNYKRAMGDEFSLVPDYQKGLSKCLLNEEIPDFRSKLNDFFYIITLCVLRDQINIEKLDRQKENKPIILKVTKLKQLNIKKPIFDLTIDFKKSRYFLTSESNTIASDLELFSNVVLNTRIMTQGYFLDMQAEVWKDKGKIYFDRISSLNKDKIIREIKKQICLS